MIDFDKLGGIVPVVVQDDVTNEVLMVAFMNEDAWRLTRETGEMWYYSRKRNALWHKGEQSGNVQTVRSIHLDCDNDTLLARIEQTGGACDQGTRSCFDKQWRENSFEAAGERVFDPTEVYANYAGALRIAIPEGSLFNCTAEIVARACGCIRKADGTFLEPIIASTREYEFVLNPVRDIARVVERGECDAGITGFDLALEAQCDIVPVTNLGFNKRGRGPAIWAIAVPEASAISSIHDLVGATIATELCNVTSSYLERNAISARMKPCSGSNHELFTGGPAVDLIETGATLARHGYRPVAPVLWTSAILIASPASYAYTRKRRAVEALGDRLIESVAQLPLSPKQPFAFDALSETFPATTDWAAYRRSWFRRYAVPA